jgi:ribonuclease P protein component
MKHSVTDKPSTGASEAEDPLEIDAEVCLVCQDFPKAVRLISPKDFQHVFSNAKKFANRHWTFIVRPNNLPYPRLGLAIAKKQLAKAVWRNRVKRLARETFRLHKSRVAGYDIVVLTRHGVQNVDNQTLRNSFLHLLKKVEKSGLKDSSQKL